MAIDFPKPEDNLQENEEEIKIKVDELLQHNERIKIHREAYGFLWKWESEGDFLRMIKIQKSDKTINNFAEILIEDLIENEEKIIVNLD